MKRLLVCLGLLLALMSPALSVSPDELLDDPVLEQRARAISAGLRCLVCQNQSIDDSDADLAKDLRILVRERLVAGDTDAEVQQYLVDRFGEYVLLNPRLNEHTWILWIAAPALLAAGLGSIWVASRKRPVTAGDETLSEEEQRVLAELSETNDGKTDKA